MEADHPSLPHPPARKSGAGRSPDHPRHPDAAAIRKEGNSIVDGYRASSSRHRGKYRLCPGRFSCPCDGRQWPFPARSERRVTDIPRGLAGRGAAAVGSGSRRRFQAVSLSEQTTGHSRLLNWHPDRPHQLLRRPRHRGLWGIWVLSVTQIPQILRKRHIPHITPASRVEMPRG